MEYNLGRDNVCYLWRSGVKTTHFANKLVVSKKQDMYLLVIHTRKPSLVRKDPCWQNLENPLSPSCHLTSSCHPQPAGGNKWTLPIIYLCSWLYSICSTTPRTVASAKGTVSKIDCLGCQVFPLDSQSIIQYYLLYHNNFITLLYNIITWPNDKQLSFYSIYIYSTVCIEIYEYLVMLVTFQLSYKVTNFHRLAVTSQILGLANTLVTDFRSLLSKIYSVFYSKCIKWRIMRVFFFFFLILCLDSMLVRKNNLSLT